MPALRFCPWCSVGLGTGATHKTNCTARDIWTRCYLFTTAETHVTVLDAIAFGGLAALEDQAEEPVTHPGNTTPENPGNL
jgi:hypothetical protein